MAGQSNSGFERKLAANILRLQKAQGGVPPNVIASAGRIARGAGNTGDSNVIRQYRGIARTGATAAKAGMKNIGQTIGKAGQLAVLGTVVAGGGGGSIFAAAQMTNILSQEIDKASRSGALSKMLDAAFKRPAVSKLIENKVRAAAMKTEVSGRKRIGELNAMGVLDAGQQQELFGLGSEVNQARKVRIAKNANLARFKQLKKLGVRTADQQSEFDSLSGVIKGDTEQKLNAMKLKDKIGRYGRMAGAAAQYIAAGAAITKFNVGLGEALGGASGGEALRIAQSESRIANAGVDTRAKKIAGLTAEIEKTKAGTDFIPLLGNTISSWRTGKAAQERADLNIKEAVAATGLTSDVTVDGVREKALERVMKEKYGVLGGSLGEKRDALLKSMGIVRADLEKEVEAAAVGSIRRAAGLKSQAMEAAAMMDFRGAQELLNQARAELPQSVPAWMNVDAMYKMQAESRASVKMFGRLQAPRSGPRTGD